MSVRDGVANLDKEVDSSLRRDEGFLLNDLCQRLTIYVVHDDKRRAVAGNAIVIYCDEISMGQVFGCLSLLLESSCLGIVCSEVRAEQFDCEILSQQPIVYLEDGAHATFSDLRHYFVSIAEVWTFLFCDGLWIVDNQLRGNWVVAG